jgi:hypothetical protein
MSHVRALFDNLIAGGFKGGDKWAALTNYEIYLKANPDDAQMRSFTNKLRVELGEAPVVADIQEVEEDPSGAKTSLFVGGGLGALLAGADDLNSLSAGAKYNGALALGLDASADYHFSGGYVGGARIVFGPNRSHSTDGAFKTTTDVSHFGIFVAPGMRLPKSKREWWDLRVGLGFLSTSVTSTTNLSGSNVTRTLTGTGLGLWPEFGYVRLFDKRVEGMVSLGYLLSSESVTDSTGKAFNLGTGGLSARLGLSYHI